MEYPTRRSILRLAGVGITAIAGCASGNNGEETETSTPTSPPASTSTPTSTPSPTPTPLPVPEYETVRVEDVSYSNVVRAAMHIKPKRPVSELSEQELRLVAEEVVAEGTDDVDVNAIMVLFWEQEAIVGAESAYARIVWAPNGNWEDAGEVETGDYSQHEYSLTVFKTPTPTETETPSETPTETETPTQASIPDESSYSFSYNFSTTTVSFEIAGGFTTFDMKHAGDSNFIVDLNEALDGETEVFLANKIGKWEGIVPTYVAPGDYVLDVTANGSWEVIVRQPRHTLAEAESPPVTGSDDIPNYVGPVVFDGTNKVSFEFDGESYAVKLLDDEGKTKSWLFSDVEDIEDQPDVLYRGLGYIRVEATGAWEVTIT